MDELYIENFSKRTKREEESERPIIPSFQQPDNTHKESRALIYQMIVHLDQLEMWIKQHYQYDEGLLYLFAKIKKKITERSLEGVTELLNRLEELLDLDLPQK